MLAALEPLDQGRFVVDAAAGAVDQPHARLQHFELRQSIRLRVSSVSGVCTVR